MGGRRHTVVIADRSNGVVRRVTIPLRPTLLTVASVTLPILMGLGARWSARVELDQVRSSNDARKRSYRPRPAN
jgi:hypothetical protein